MDHPELIEILTRLLANPGSTQRWGHLALAYSVRRGEHHVAVSRHGSYPTQVAIKPLIEALGVLGHTGGITQKMDLALAGSPYRTLRLTWPVAVQIAMLDWEETIASE